MQLFSSHNSTSAKRSFGIGATTLLNVGLAFATFALHSPAGALTWLSFQDGAAGETLPLFEINHSSPEEPPDAGEGNSNVLRSNDKSLRSNDFSCGHGWFLTGFKKAGLGGNTQSPGRVTLETTMRAAECRKRAILRELPYKVATIQIRNASRWMRICCGPCKAPFPIPGQTLPARRQELGVATTLGQKGQVRHWAGRSS